MGLGTRVQAPKKARTIRLELDVLDGTAVQEAGCRGDKIAALRSDGPFAASSEFELSAESKHTVSLTSLSSLTITKLPEAVWCQQTISSTTTEAVRNINWTPKIP